MDELKFIEELKDLISQKKEVDKQVKAIEEEEKRLAGATFEKGSLEHQISERRKAQVKEQEEQLKDQMYQKIAILKNQINNEIAEKRKELEGIQNQYHKKVEEDLEMNERAEQWEAFYEGEYEFTDKDFDKELAEQALKNIEEKQNEIVKEIQDLDLLRNSIALDYNKRDFEEKQLGKLEKYIASREKALKDIERPVQQGQPKPQEKPVQQGQPKPQEKPVKQATKRIIGIELGKEPSITYLNKNGRKIVKPLTFSQTKKCLELGEKSKLKLLGQIDKEMAEELIKDENKKVAQKLDPVAIALLRKAIDYGIDKKEVKEVLDMYKESIVDGKSEAQESMKKILTYNRAGMDFKKMTTFIPQIFRGKIYDKIKDYCMYAEQCAKIEPDTPGFWAKIYYKHHDLMLPNGKYMESRLGESNKKKEQADKQANRQAKKDISKSATKEMKKEVATNPSKYTKLHSDIVVDEETQAKLDAIAKKYQTGEITPPEAQKTEKQQKRDQKKMAIEMGKAYFDGNNQSYKTSFDMEKAIKRAEQEEERE